MVVLLDACRGGAGEFLRESDVNCIKYIKSKTTRKEKNENTTSTTPLASPHSSYKAPSL